VRAGAGFTPGFGCRGLIGSRGFAHLPACSRLRVDDGFCVFAVR
jgi:hypothetical protein